MVTDNQCVSRRDPGQMSVLRHQRAQYRHQFQCISVINLNDAGDQLLGRCGRKTVEGFRRLFGIDLLHHLDDLFSRYGGEPVHLQYRQKQIVNFILVHRCA